MTWSVVNTRLQKRKENLMSQNPTPRTRRPLIQRIWKPAVGAGTGGAITVTWWEEILLFGTEILTLITIPILAGAVYLFDTLAFKARHPRRQDLPQSQNKKGISK